MFNNLNIKRESLFEQLATSSYFFKTFNSFQDFLIVIANVFLAILLFVSNFLYLFFVLFEQKTMESNFFKNITIDFRLIFLSLLLIMSRFLCTIGSFIENNEDHKDDLLIEEISRREQEDRDLRNIIDNDLQFIECQIKSYHSKFSTYIKLLSVIKSVNQSSQTKIQENSYDYRIDISSLLDEFIYAKNSYPSFVYKSVVKRSLFSDYIASFDEYYNKSQEHHEKVKNIASLLLDDFECLDRESNSMIESIHRQKNLPMQH